MLRRHYRFVSAMALLLAIVPAGRLFAADTDTQTLYLSGKGKDDPVKWDFMCSAGMNAGKWSTIGVPSNWELQGFGIYTYGTDRKNPWPKVTGNYKRTFTVPDGWAGRQISIVFEGSMTDTQVKVNGESAGAIHQGGFYEFKYDITKLLKAGENTLEVTVDDESANPTVNSAERRGDYWNYAGIFRPVLLEAVPQTSISHLAIDAQADGTLKADVRVVPGPLAAELWVKLQVRDAAGNAVGAPVTHILDGAAGPISFQVANPKLWNAETPNLYTLEASVGTGAVAFHTVHQKFGFRTIEARPGQGLFVNGTRIMLKGADRHSFWPDSGRCLSEKISRDDLALMKDMNMNAVRCSHYPPDRHFLDACDELGMYVLDELAGWHAKYDTTVGQKLVNEMVTRDVNHPCILFWDNGNESGWNTALDGEFSKYDPQKRLVLHPWDPFPQGIIDTKHYPSYDLLNQKLSGNAVYFATEMLHGLYDGGHGAGLDDYWQAMMKSKVGAGGFLWSLNDEDIVRTDKGGKLDSNGNQAPDGITGPYREKEGSFYTVKQLWSPIVLLDTKPGLRVENRYAFTDLSQCSFSLESRKFYKPGDANSGHRVVSTSQVTTNGSIPPGQAGDLIVVGSRAINSSGEQIGDVYALTAKDPSGRLIWTWIRPVSEGSMAGSPEKVASTNTVASTESDAALTANVGDLSLSFDKKTGLLSAASRAGKTFSFLNGPRLLVANPTQAAPGRGATAPAPLPPLPTSALTSITQKTDGTDVLLTAAFDGPMKAITYRLHPNGWLTIDYAYSLTGPHEYFGVGFDYPEASVQSMRYLGNGPATVYQNRIAGGTLDVWDKKYNNTMVGDPDDLEAGQKFDYPIFKGFYAGVRWLQLNTTEGPITALVNQNEAQPLYVQVFTPKTPPANIIGQTGVPFPKAGISFLHAIPAIGSKFNGPKSTGPSGQPAVAKGDYKGSISLYFGALGQP